MTEQDGTGPHRYLALDGLRGVAALAIALTHAGYAPSGFWFFGQGSLAVDFFFILSGFVLAHAYGERLRMGGALPFLRDRVIRLHPLLVLSSLPGAALLLLRAFRTGGASPQDWGTVIAGLVPFPTFWLSSRPSFWFTLNQPVWSLFWEYAVNIVYALIAPWLSTRVLVLLVALSVATTLAISVGGGGMMSVQGPRAFAAFPIGILLYRIHAAGGARLTPLAPLAAPLLLLSLAVPSFGWWDRLYQPGAALLLYPFLLLAAAGHAPRHPRLAELLGQLSYPFYLLHLPVMIAFTLVESRMPGLPWPLLAAIKVAAAAAVAWIALRYFDEPVRAWLRRRFVRQPGGGGSGPAPRT